MPFFTRKGSFRNKLPYIIQQREKETDIKHIHRTESMVITHIPHTISEVGKSMLKCVKIPCSLEITLG